MHIKKLEISGFKSFVDRTVIHFDHDVIAIVGPNGCGKSNIVDAIRWCMGEQSARHLRGKSMEDVIFNGSETRAPHGMAEVTLTFDNTDPEIAATLPIEYREYAEIAVTRRLSRDGTSEYLLNKTPVRLKDVVDVFLGTGVGTKAYSIVEQGKVGLIVSARPEDRRAIIEEAAGITKYKARKKATERKMELTDQNLLRVGDRVAELERNVSSLGRQAAKAERYIQYRNELERLMLHQASHQLLGLVAREKFEAERKTEVGLLVEQNRGELEAADAALEARRAEALDLEVTTEEAQKEAFAADNEMRALEAELSRATDKLEHLGERLASGERERGDLTERIAALESERKAVAEALTGLEAEQTTLAGETLAEQEKLEGLRGEERGAEAELGELRVRSSRASSQMAAAQAKLDGFDRRSNEMQARRAKLANEAEHLAAEHGRLEAKRTELAAQVASLEEQKTAAAAERTRVDGELGELRKGIVEREKELDIVRQDLAHKKARLRALEEMHERLEGVGDGVKNLLSSRDPSLLGLFVDRIEVPSELSTALAGLLGDALECVVVNDVERATALLEELGRGKKGRATVIGRSVRRVVGLTRDVPSGPGVVGLVVDELGFAAEDEPLVRALVGDALLVETAEDALRIAPRVRGRHVVTLDGTVVRPDGRVSGGSSDTMGRALVLQQQEMRTLREQVATCVTRVEEATSAHRELRDRIAELSRALDHARQEAHKIELALVTASKDHRRSEEQLAAEQRRSQVVASEIEEIDRLLGDASKERAGAEAALEEGRAMVAELEGAIADAGARVNGWREKTAAQLAVVTERKVRLARVREQVSSGAGSVERLARSIGELSARAERLDEELTDAAAQSGQTAAVIMNTREQQGEATVRAETAHEALARAKQAFDAARAALATGETTLKELRSRLAEASERLGGHELSLQKLLIEKDHLLAGVREKFRGLELARVVGDYHLLPPPDEAHSSRISDLSHLIDRMGPVNIDATREHAEEKGRLDYFREQKADLEKALDDLRRAILQMNRESKRLFREAFDAINDRFKILFPKMFRGGRAELQLTNPEDLLETGIEIIAQPPGKKLGNIELMSGGEKALTAVSLIFAIFQYKPSPFCILDEVDAPLDEANVTRYNELIRDMTDRSQFILITHIKKTMQSADVLYGVTMQEAGISRLVSVKVGDAVQRRRSGTPGGLPAAGEQAAAVA